MATRAESSVPNYRKAVREALPAEVFRADNRNLLWIPVHAAIIGVSWWLLAAHFSFWTTPFLALLVGHSFGCMGFIAHDIAHGGGVRNPRLRDALSGVCFAPFWISPYLWRRWHNAEHHGHTQVEGVDPDHLFTIEFYQQNPVLRFLYRLPPFVRNVIVFGSFSFRMNQQTLRMAWLYLTDRDETRRQRLIIVAQTLAGILGFAGATLLLGTQVLVWGYVLPILVGNAIVIGYIATNHFLNPLEHDERDVLATSLSVTLPRPLRWLDGMHQAFGAHVAHHLFPHVSAHNVRTIDAKLAELFPDRFHQMPLLTALAKLWTTPWVYSDHRTLTDPQRGISSPTLGHGL